jgi:hypothetical protein
MSKEKIPKAPPPVFKSFGQRLRSYLFAGILVTAPVGVTIYIAWTIVNFVDNQVSPLFPEPVYGPYGIIPQIPGLGLIVLLLGLTLIGALATNIFGNLIVRASDQIFNRMPVIRGLYGLLKQMFEMLVGEANSENPEVLEQLHHVPILYERVKLKDLNIHSVADLLNFATGPSFNPNVQREGVTFKRYDPDVNDTFSFKAISESWLSSRK